MKIQAVMTIDIGTSSIRVSLFALDGTLLDWAAQPAFAPAQFDVEPRMEVMLSLMKSLVEKHPQADIVRICPSTLISWIFCKKDGQALTPVYTFADFHTAELKKFLKDFSGQEFYRRTGRAASAELPLFKMAWLKKEHPELYAQADYMLSYNGYINLCLTGKATIDRTFAAFSGLSRIEGGIWDEEIAAAAGLDLSKLPPQCQADMVVGKLTPEMGRRLGIPHALVVCGTSDGSSGALGSGMFEPGNALDVMGTTDVFYAVCQNPVFEKNARLCVHPHPLDGLWLAGGATGLTGGAFDWALKTLGQGKIPYEEINRQMEGIAPGSDGLSAVCAFSGERAPRWLPEVRGGFVGLTVDHTLAHCCRALSEASAYLTREICDLLTQSGLSIKRVTAIGGGAKSDTVVQLRSDVLGRAMCVPTHLDATIRGCYALAMLSLGIPAGDIPINQEARRFAPNVKYAAEYDRLFPNYIAFYQQYKKLYQTI